MKDSVQRFGIAPGLRYGRSPAEQILSDSREMSLALERFSAIGSISRGTTVWRHSRGDWRILPDPEKALLPQIKPGAIIYIERLDRRRTYDHS